MSTFLGLIEEIPGISIDCFVNENLHSSVYFLSHCHWDHMEGLSQYFFESLLNQNKVLFCSHISKSLLTNTFPILQSQSSIENNLKELPLDDAKLINYNHNNVNYSIEVTCISSGHCPGSIMFLFQYKTKSILYTGDFRINVEDIKKIKSLHYGQQNIPINIDNLYLDTTFLNFNPTIFPSRSESLNKLCSFAKSWIEKDAKNVVFLEISATYGSEYIYVELSKLLNAKVHVMSKLLDVYKKIHYLSDKITDLATSTPIHACISKRDNLYSKGLQCRPDVHPDNILTIIPSVLKWADKDASIISSWDDTRAQTLNIFYSTHSSFQELKSFIVHFKPQNIFACVDNDIKKTYETLSKIQTEMKNECSLEMNFSEYKIFSKTNFKSEFISDDDESD